MCTRQTVFLMLAEEHPLIRFGFSGTLRFVEDVEVVVGASAGRRRRRRWLATRDRRALLLIAEGCGPLELSGRLGLCFERAEALHDDLFHKFELDRIARQVRSALAHSPGAPSVPGLIEAVRMASAIRHAEPSEDGSMYDEDLVRSLFPEAVVRVIEGSKWVIEATEHAGACRLGEGRSVLEAWAEAAIRLSQDEWFRPIIQQINSFRSECRGGN